MRWRRFATPTLRWSRPDSCRTRARRRATTGLVRFATAQTEAFDDFSVEPKAFIDAGDKVVVPLRFGGRASHTGLQVHFDVVHVCTARDGKWAQVDMYATESAALKAVGLQEWAQLVTYAPSHARHDPNATRVSRKAMSLREDWRHGMRNAPIIRAAERVGLACQVLKAAANDVLIAQSKEHAPVEEAAQELAAEIEHVCELADQLERCAASLGELAGARG